MTTETAGLSSTKRSTAWASVRCGVTRKALVDQPHVFDRFYRSTITRTEPGSGLGLAIVKQIVDRHGGHVWATNHPDGGALVGFQLPSDEVLTAPIGGRPIRGK